MSLLLNLAKLPLNFKCFTKKKFITTPYTATADGIPSAVFMQIAYLYSLFSLKMLLCIILSRKNQMNSMVHKTLFCIKHCVKVFCLEYIMSVFEYWSIGKFSFCFAHCKTVCFEVDGDCICSC